MKCAVGRWQTSVNPAIITLTELQESRAASQDVLAKSIGLNKVEYLQTPLYHTTVLYGKLFNTFRTSNLASPQMYVYLIQTHLGRFTISYTTHSFDHNNIENPCVTVVKEFIQVNTSIKTIGLTCLDLLELHHQDLEQCLHLPTLGFSGLQVFSEK